MTIAAPLTPPPPATTGSRGVSASATARPPKPSGSASNTMTDTTASSLRTGGLGKVGEIIEIIRQSNAGLAIGVVAIIAVLVLPLPAILHDMLLALSFVFSVIILMTALFIQTPLEFSSFPTVLLVATMFRMAL